MLGTLVTENRHGYLEPIQATTLELTRQIEQGLQWVETRERWRGEAYVNWQHLNTSDSREVFDYGIVASWRSWRWLHLEGQLHGLHRGGQLHQVGAVSNNLVEAVGARGEWELGGTLTGRVAAFALRSEGRVDPEQDTPRRSRANGLYLRAGVTFGRIGELSAIWWRGRDFISVEGDRNYGSVGSDGVYYRSERSYQELAFVHRRKLGERVELDAGGSAAPHRRRLRLLLPDRRAGAVRAADQVGQALCLPDRAGTLVCRIGQTLLSAKPGMAGTSACPTTADWSVCPTDCLLALEWSWGSHAAHRLAVGPAAVRGGRRCVALPRHLRHLEPGQRGVALGHLRLSGKEPSARSGDGRPECHPVGGHQGWRQGRCLSRTVPGACFASSRTCCFLVCTARWSRFSCLLAVLLAGGAFSALVARAASGNASLSGRRRAWLVGWSIAGFGLASPVVYLISTARLYHEPILWALAWSLTGIWLTWELLRTEGRSSWAQIGLAACAAGGLLTRLVSGLPLVMVWLFMAVWCWRQQPRREDDRGWARRLAPLLAGVAVIGVAVAFTGGTTRPASDRSGRYLTTKVSISIRRPSEESSTCVACRRASSTTSGSSRPTSLRSRRSFAWRPPCTCIRRCSSSGRRRRSRCRSPRAG